MIHPLLIRTDFVVGTLQIWENEGKAKQIRRATNVAGEDTKEPWIPSSSDDWAKVFADGIALDRENVRKQNEAAAEEAAKNGQNGGGDNDDKRPISVRDRLLGNR